MHLGKRLFPYPILNHEKLYSQFKKSTFALTYDEELTNDQYILKNIKCDLTDDTLIGLINDNKVRIVCVIECAETMFRKNYELFLEPSSIKLPLKDLNGKISVSACIVANEDIDDYFSLDFLEDYEDYHFRIEKNDILAVDDGFVSKVSFNEEEDIKKSSIFVVIKDKTIKDETMQIEYDSSNITIYLPEEQWNTYDKTKRLKKLENLYFSILAIPALSYAVSDLQAKGDFYVDTLRMDYKWFNSFASQYEKVHGEELTDEKFRKMNPNVEAQRLMNTPVTKALDDIFSFTMGIFGGEEDGD